MMIARLVFAGFIAIALAASLTYLRNRPVRGQLVEILPPDSAELDLRAWVHLFQGLYGMSRPWWKRWLFGQPSIALELDRRVGAARQPESFADALPIPRQ